MCVLKLMVHILQAETETELKLNADSRCVGMFDAVCSFGFDGYVACTVNMCVSVRLYAYAFK